MNFQKVLAVAIVVISAVSCSEAASCLPQFKNIKALESTSTVCIKRLEQQGIKIADISKPTESNNWNDTCKSNCTLGELGFMVNSTINTDNMIAMIKENAPAKAVDKLTAFVNECAKNVSMKKDKKFGDKPPKPKAETAVSPKFDMKKKDKVMHGFKHYACKKAAKFMACYEEKEAQVC